MTNPLKDFQLDRSTIQFIGKDLQRPECILAERDGTLWAADGRGGIMKIFPDGEQELILQKGLGENVAASFEDRYVNTMGSLPNGLTFDANGDFLIANFGTDRLEFMKRSGESRVMIDNIDGRPLGKANFVTRDSKGRLWLTVTTQTIPWTDHVKINSRDGYIALIDDKSIRIVADNLCGTNELRFDAKEEWVYVAETTSRNITRFKVEDNGDLTHREIYGPSNIGGFCDGIAFDSYGNLWSTLIMADRLVAITPEGDLLTILDDGQPENTAILDRAWEEGKVTPELMAQATGTLCPWMASLTFGGPDLKTVYLGSLRGDRIPYFTSPVAGLPLIYW
ncbi:SMP-30/gluconolactonase/LRE family protein [Rhizobium sp.]|jgi:gluconolactonase|uniref:SMP-30/gluconolactonase/LRE family protein n=1 Tax=Rhizobium sp. TaxID=391 RepID=UPI000E9D08FF|nr:gluconolactonase [Rhizobium sp.]